METSRAFVKVVPDQEVIRIPLALPPEKDLILSKLVAAVSTRNRISVAPIRTLTMGRRSHRSMRTSLDCPESGAEITECAIARSPTTRIRVNRVNILEDRMPLDAGHKR